MVSFQKVCAWHWIGTTAVAIFCPGIVLFILSKRFLPWHETSPLKLCRKKLSCNKQMEGAASVPVSTRPTKSGKARRTCKGAKKKATTGAQRKKSGHHTCIIPGNPGQTAYASPATKVAFEQTVSAMESGYDLNQSVSQ